MAIVQKRSIGFLPNLGLFLNTITLKTCALVPSFLQLPISLAEEFFWLTPKPLLRRFLNFLVFDKSVSM